MGDLSETATASSKALGCCGNTCTLYSTSDDRFIATILIGNVHVGIVLGDSGLVKYSIVGDISLTNRSTCIISTYMVGYSTKILCPSINNLT